MMRRGERKKKLDNGKKERREEQSEGSEGNGKETRHWRG